MDRFIAINSLLSHPHQQDLKSNMDRFIGFINKKITFNFRI